MLDTAKLSFDASVDILKALAEPTRLRLVRLLSLSDLTVTDLTSILGQSQPRVSRHLKLLVESGILSRYQEGSWAYFRLADQVATTALVRSLVSRIEEGDPALARDIERLDGVRRERADRAAAYFSRNAEGWDRLRRLHAADAGVEAALLAALGEERVAALLDIGTGTGRLLELLAPLADRAVGVDASREMLQVARAKLEAAGITNALVRQGDCYHLPLARSAFDLVTIHQVLHYLDDPAGAVREAAAMLRPGGRLVLVDFAPHAQEFLRTEHAHLRLGFTPEALESYLADAGLSAVHRERVSAGAEGAGALDVLLVVGAAPQAPASAKLSS